MARLLLQSDRKMTPRDSDILAVFGVVAMVAVLGFWRMLGS
jgi:hypothetical protein